MNDDNELRDIVAKVLDDRDIGDDWDADAILAAIREHHAIVKLPEPDCVDGLPAFWNYSLIPTPNEVVTDFGLGTEFKSTLSVGTCRALAAALLAAADVAEREQ